jgi:hypothetical protein
MLMTTEGSNPVPALPPFMGSLPHEVSLNTSENLEELIEEARLVPTNAIVDAPSAWHRGSLSATSVWMRVVWQRTVPPSTGFYSSNA